MNAFERTRIRARDFIRYGKKPRLVISHSLELADRFYFQSDSDLLAESLNRLTLAARLGTDLRSLSALEAKIKRRIEQWSPDHFDWKRFFPDAETPAVTKAIILKRPRGGEKGALFVSFEYNWLRLLRFGDLEQLSRDYDLVLAPSYSPPHDLAFLIAARLWPGALFTTLSNFDDAEAFTRMSPKVRPIRLLASNWVDSDTVAPRSEIPKQFDIAVPGTFAPVKRHFVLFRALRKMDSSVRVLLLGRAFGPNSSRELLERQARLYGVGDRISVKEGPPRASWMPMLRALMSAKISLVLSMQEGSNVSVVESMFADVPVGVVEGGRVGSKAFINNQTGEFLRPERMAEDLTVFLARHRDYRPRAWALENGISCRESSRTLNASLKDWALQNGRPWTVDLLPMNWRPDPEYMSRAEAESLRDEYQRFETAYGVRVNPTPLMSASQ